jgi:REP element-mobilizing transposase RayT
MFTHELIFLNPAETVEKHRNFLPHWQQDDATFFVTWHLGDSIPKPMLERWKRERDEWLRCNPEPWTEEQEKEYHEAFTAQKERWLDKGHGSCVFRDPAVSAIAGDVLRHFDGLRYRHHSWVVMPNHVHALFSLVKGFFLEDTLKDWKGVSARHINELLNTGGKLWQKDYFDRIVRDLRHFANCAKYIRRNPLKAKLRPGEYLLYERAEIAAMEF